ncbi:hypothetical protein WDZ92_54055, partial [Nostoc sp. NIES-2111]
MAHGQNAAGRVPRGHDGIIGSIGPATFGVFQSEAERLSSKGSVDRVLVIGEPSGSLGRLWNTLLPNASISTAAENRP